MSNFMESLKVLLLATLLTMVFVACSGDDEIESFTLTVTNGTGSGVYKVGQTVTITAVTAQEGKEFDRWAGDVNFLADVGNGTTTLAMPAKDASIPQRTVMLI